MAIELKSISEQRPPILNARSGHANDLIRKVEGVARMAFSNLTANDNVSSVINAEVGIFFNEGTSRQEVRDEQQSEREALEKMIKNLAYSETFENHGFDYGFPSDMKWPTPPKNIQPETKPVSKDPVPFDYSLGEDE